MSKRRTALLLGLVPLVAVGLSACTTSSGRPQVQDLSISRNSETPSTYTVKSGDTIYGIAWQNRVDFRDLAQLNGISPPYRLEPGQQLRLQSGASVAGGQAIASSGSGGGGVTATGLGGANGNRAQSAAGDDNPSWLLPSGGSSGSTAGGQGSGQAASGGSSPGPVYAQSGAADGTRDNTSSASAPQSGSSANAGDRGASTNTNTSASTGGQAAGAAGSVASTSSGKTDTGSSSSSASLGGGGTKTATGADAGTEVAGEPSGAPDRSDRTYKPVENVPWQWPANGRLVGKFDDDSNITPGIDIAGQKGQPVKAAGPGIVVYAGDGVRGYGNLIILKHNDRFLSAYAHNDSLKVKENDVVEAGETIATMGQTDADQVQLHFEVRVNGQPQDPLQYLPAR